MKDVKELETFLLTYRSEHEQALPQSMAKDLAEKLAAALGWKEF